VGSSLFTPAASRSLAPFGRNSSAVYRLEAKRIALAVEMLLNHAELTVQDSEVVDAALEHYRAKPVLGFSDCLVLETARKAGHLPLGTFDRELGKLKGAVRL
jgi:predicted nucleic-acid-binding protein